MTLNKIFKLIFLSITLIISLACASGGSESFSDSTNLSAGTGDSNSGSTSESTQSGSTSQSSTSLELDIHNRVNEYRASLGLQPLMYIETIASISREHSENMANGIVPIGHDNFNERVNAIVFSIGASSVAENVAFAQGHSNPNAVVVDGWINSPGHEANMRGNFNYSGVGIAMDSNGGYYYTHMFAR